MTLRSVSSLAWFRSFSWFIAVVMVRAFVRLFVPRGQAHFPITLAGHPMGCPIWDVPCYPMGCPMASHFSHVLRGIPWYPMISKIPCGRSHVDPHGHVTRNPTMELTIEWIIWIFPCTFHGRFHEIFHGSHGVFVGRKIVICPMRSLMRCPMETHRMYNASHWKSDGPHGRCKFPSGVQRDI